MIAQIDPFQAIEIGRIAHDLAQSGRSVIHMEFGQPSTGAPPSAIAAAHAVLDADAMGYWESPRLKQRLAEHYRNTQGVAVAAERIILTCGASPALVLALTSLFRPGDRVAFARPGYVAYRNVARTLYLEPVEIGCGPADRFQLTAAALQALQPAPQGVIIASPANPTGTIITPDEMIRIVGVCKQRGIKIVSDEIYHGLGYTRDTRSVLRDTGDAVVINSFSKYFSMAGWRLGWLVVPPDLLAPASARAGNLFLTPPALAQHAGLAAFDDLDELERHRDVYRRNRAMMLEALPAMGLRRIAPPDGAFYIYADIGHLTADSVAFCKALLFDTGVAAAPGVDFDPLEGGRFMRFSFAVATREVEDALARLRPWFAGRRPAG